MDFEPRPAEPKSTLAGTVAWGGAIVWHFGHQIADFTTRLVSTLAELPDVRFAFSMREPPPFTTVEETPAHFRAILDWYGIEHERVELIAEPTLVERLVVAPQAEQPGGPGPQSWYLDALDVHTTSRLGEIERSGSLYVSRAGQEARFAGERYLERAFEEIGFRVVRPETLPLEEQLRAYADAETIAFADGSAIHGPQLMGRALGDVKVLVRRPAGGQQAKPVLGPRSRSFRGIVALKGVVHGLNPSGGQALFRGLSVLDPERLLTEFPLDPVWDQAAYEQARDEDVIDWLEREQASATREVPGSPAAVRESLGAAGLDHLL